MRCPCGLNSDKCGESLFFFKSHFSEAELCCSAEDAHFRLKTQDLGTLVFTLFVAHHLIL